MYIKAMHKKDFRATKFKIERETKFNSACITEQFLIAQLALGLITSSTPLTQRGGRPRTASWRMS